MKIIDRLIQKKMARFKGLEEKLKHVSNIPLSQELKLRMKGQIMSSLRVPAKASFSQALADLIEKIKTLTLEIRPSPVFQNLLRDKLEAVVNFHAQRFSWIPFWVQNHRRLWAGLVAVVFVFGVLFNFTFNIQQAEASFVTSLEEVSGTVFVVRENQQIRGEPHFLLKADDIIKTEKDSKAVIRFLDQSVGRLDENTEVKIAKLFINPFNKTETIVELVLREGRFWARVINLIDNLSRFQVKARNTVAVAKKKAAFDISVTAKGKAKVSAVQNRVDLTVATDKKVIETTLMKGFTAEIKTNAPLAPQIRAEQSGDQKDQWVAENLAQDKAYIETVKQENQAQSNEQFQVLPGSPFYAMKEISEGTKMAFTLDAFERQKKLLAATQEKFAEAQAFAAKGNMIPAQELLLQFQSQMQELLQWIWDNEASNPVQAFALQSQIREVLNAYQKQFALILPSDSLYGLKEVVAKMQIVMAPNPQQKTLERLSQAGDKLLEAHDLVEQGDTVQAKEQVEAYSKAISEVVSEVKQLPSDAKEQAVSALLDNKVEDLKALEAIAATPFPGSSSIASVPVVPTFPGSSTTGTCEACAKQIMRPKGATIIELFFPETVIEKTAAPSDQESSQALQKTVTEAKTDALTKLGEAVLDVQKTESSSEVLKKLEDIKKVDVNGKPMVNVTLTRDRVSIKSNGAVISVSGSSTPAVMPPTTDSKIPESPRAQP